MTANTWYTNKWYTNTHFSDMFIWCFPSVEWQHITNIRVRKLAQFFLLSFGAIIKHTIFLIKGVTIFRRYPELFRESDVRIFWNVSVIINETVKEYVSHRLISPTRSFLPENSPRSIFVLLSKKHRSNGWRSHFIAFVYNIWQESNFSFVTRLLGNRL